MTNPYLNGRQEWLERYGSYIKRAHQWRLAALIFALLAIMCLAGMVIMAGQYKVIPYIVAVDSLGKAVATSRADIASPVPARLIQAELANLIINWRTVTPDLDLQRKMLEKLSFFIAGSAKGQLREWFEANNPYEKSGKGSLVQVSIKGVPHAVSNDSWRVEWVETARNHTGALLEAPKTFEATLTVQINPPTTDEQILKNPGGVFVTGLSFSTILETNQSNK